MNSVGDEPVQVMFIFLSQAGRESLFSKSRKTLKWLLFPMRKLLRYNYQHMWHYSALAAKLHFHRD